MSESMSEQVADRERLLFGDDSNKTYDPIAALDLDFVRECFQANERGDGLLLAALLHNQYLYVTTPDKKGEWYWWDKHVWKQDEFDDHFNLVEQAALAYEGYAYDIEAQKDAHLEELATEREAAIVEIKAKFGEDEAKEKIDKLLKKTLHPPEWMPATIKSYRDRAWKLRSKNKMTTALFMAPRVDPRIATVAEELDQKKWLLPCLNGIIDLERGILVEGQPTDLMTKQINVKYNPEADYSLWQETIDTICIDPKIPGSEELPAFLKRLFGYAITGNVSEEFLAIFLGPGRNGKGTIIETITKIMGPYYHKANRSLFVEQKFEPPPSATSEHMYAMLGKRLVIGSETNKNQRIDMGRTKDLTGGNEINYRRNYGSEKTYTPTHTLLLETNNLAYGLTKEFSMLQRLILIDFSYMFVEDIEAEEKKTPALKGQFKKINKNLKDHLKTPEQMEGVLRWLIEGTREWNEKGLQIPDCIIKYRNTLSGKEDHIQTFIDDIMELQEDRETLRMSFADFYKAFAWWWKENMDDVPGNKMTHKNTLSKWLDHRKLKTEKIGGVKWVFHFDVKDEVKVTVPELSGLAKEFL